MTHATTRETLHLALAQALAAAATAAGDRVWSASASETEVASTSVDEIHHALEISGALRGTLALQISRADARLLSPAASENDLGPAWQRLGDTVADQMGRALTQSLGHTALRAASDPPPGEALRPVVSIVLRANDEFTAVSVRCFADQALASSLLTEPSASTATAPSPGRDAAPMNRVIDVPLAVTIRFGQRQLLLRELLELSTGSLLELDRQVEEPVDLMLGERVIARGEVVIVDGNYGMRITEVLENATRSAGSRDRLQTLSYAGV